MSERKTSRTFDLSAGVWTGSYNSNPKDVVLCEAWRLLFVQPDQEAIPEKANKTAIAEIESRNADAFTVAKDAAQTAYDSLPEPARTTLGHGINRVVGDKLNTSKAETDSLKVADARVDWVALYSGESKIRGGTDPREVARQALASLEAILNGVAVKASDKFGKDSGAIAATAKARNESVAVYMDWLDAEAEKRMPTAG